MKKSNTIYFLFIFFLTYSLGVVLRLWELPLWNAPHLHVSGEPIMATHDAYAWLAGAIGTGNHYNAPMSTILSLLHNITGLNVATINFWLPVIVAPLVCLPIIFICQLFGIIEASLVAGTIASLGTGYFLRTRMGYGDTDILTIFLPLAYCAGLIYWLKPFINNWRRKDYEFTLILKQHLLKGSIFTGFILLFYNWFYPNAYPIVMYTYIFTIFLSFLLTPRKIFINLLPGFIIILIIGFGELIGLLLASIFVYLTYTETNNNKKTLFNLVFLSCALGLLFYHKHWGAILSLIDPILNYAKIFPFLEVKKYSIKLPQVLASIREAQNVSLTMLIQRVGQNPYIFFPGLIGFVLACTRFPLLLIFLPQLGLSILSFKLGNRFTMYGPPIIGLGVSLGLTFILEKIKIKPLILYLLLTCFVIYPTINLVKILKPTPVLPQVYAKSFLEIDKIANPKAQLWQWWDYGYAAQYYAKRKSFGDGGRHNGPYLYPLALAHTTSSPLQAAQIIKFTAQDQQEQITEMQQNGTNPSNPGAKILYWPIDPVRKLNLMGATKAQTFIDSLKEKTLNFSANIPEQYFVLSWENLNLSYWISYFGNWNLITGQGVHGGFKRLKGKIDLNLSKGLVSFSGKTLPMIKLLIIKKDGTSIEKSWLHSKGLYIIYNEYLPQVIAMDKTIYNSMMVQMLLNNPNKFKPHFTLVLDKFPWVRVYKVN